MKQQSLRVLILTLALISTLISEADTSISEADTSDSFFQTSYALVIGIGSYQDPSWPTRFSCKKDAEVVTSFLTGQNYKVIVLYDKQATKKAIISKMLLLAKKLKKDDRVLIFFSGHGDSEELAGKERGYIVPYDGTKTSDSYISMETLLEYSEKMGTAKHQLFIMDSCYGGLLLDTKAPITMAFTSPLIEPSDYIKFTKQVARQIITAGGSKQQVSASEELSFFTSWFKKGVEDKQADVNKDGCIIFPELVAYLVNNASNSRQTPRYGSLPGHEGGENIFLVTPPVELDVDTIFDWLMQNGYLERISDTEGRLKGITDELKTALAKKYPDSFQRILAILQQSPNIIKGDIKSSEIFCPPMNKNNPVPKCFPFKNRFSTQSDADDVIFDKYLEKKWKITNDTNDNIFTFDEAKNYCQSLEGNWRLPTAEELGSLITKKTNKEGWGKINEKFFPVNRRTPKYWSSSSAMLNWFWYIDFDKGIRDKMSTSNYAGVFAISVD